jgi:DNA adenine methylase
MYSNKLFSPLRYPGGKSRFAPFVAALIRGNGLEGGHYLEPYAGGAGVALELLFDQVVSHIHINDYDPAVHDFWHSVTQHPEEMLRLVHDTAITIEQWHHWRSVLRGEVPATRLERGFATLFLNRTNRSGILKGGVIGGKEQKGAYRLDARFKKDVIRNRIERIASHASQITVHGEDALELLRRCSQFLPAQALIYLDPPYYIKGQELYRNFYEHKDHQQISELLCSAEFDRHWIVSYDNVDEISQMYASVKSRKYGLNYTAQKRYLGSEVMFFSSSLCVGDLVCDEPAAA